MLTFKTGNFHYMQKTHSKIFQLGNGNCRDVSNPGKILSSFYTYSSIMIKNSETDVDIVLLRAAGSFTNLL